MENENTELSDSLAAQREARRRRILQNSNNRLGKITGRVFDEEIKEPEETPMEDQEIFPDPELERDVFESTHADNQDVFELLRTINPDSPLGQPTEQKPQIPDTLLTRLIKSKLPIALIAIIVYFLFATNNEFLLGFSVFSTLILWEVLEFLFHRSSFSGQSKTSLNLIFILGGIPQRTSQTLLNILGISNKVLKDVAVFMFTFIFVHLLWSYWIVGEKLSVILDKDFNEFIKDEL